MAEAAGQRRPLRGRGPAGNRPRARRQRDRGRRRPEERLPRRRDQVARRIGQSARRSASVSGATPEATSGVHGLGLLGDQPSTGPNSSAESSTAVAAEETPEVEVEVQNQGESTENGVTVSVTVSGGGALRADDQQHRRRRNAERDDPADPGADGHRDARSQSPAGARRAGHRATTKPATPSNSNRDVRDEDRLPRPGGHLHRGRPARGGGRRELRAAAHGDRPRRDRRGRARRGRAGAGSVRELDRGVGAEHPRHARLRDAEGDDRRRARLRRARPPDRPRGARAGARSRPSSPIRSRSPSAPASCASSCPGPSGAASAAPPRRCGWSASRSEPWAAIGARAAAELYGCDDPARGDRGRGGQRHPLRLDRAGRDRARTGGGAWKTSLVFSELGEDHPGALVDALREFSSRDVNLTRIESRPLRQGLGRYMFFCDLEGATEDEAGRGGDRGAARQGRIGAGARLLPGRTACRLAATRGP